MEEIASNLRSLSWWFTAVFVAVLMNILGGYAKTGTDFVLSRVSKRWIRRSERNNAVVLSRVEQCISSPSKLKQELYEELRLRTQAVYALVFGLTLLLIPTLLSWDTTNATTTKIIEPSSIAVAVAMLLRLVGATMFIVSLRMDSKADSIEQVTTLALKSLTHAESESIKHQPGDIDA